VGRDLRVETIDIDRARAKSWCASMFPRMHRLESRASMCIARVMGCGNGLVDLW